MIAFLRPRPLRSRMPPSALATASRSYCVPEAVFGNTLLAALLLTSAGCASIPPEVKRPNTYPELREYVRATREAAGVPALAVAVADSETVLFEHADGTGSLAAAPRSPQQTDFTSVRSRSQLPQR